MEEIPPKRGRGRPKGMTRAKAIEQRRYESVISNIDPTARTMKRGAYTSTQRTSTKTDHRFCKKYISAHEAPMRCMLFAEYYVDKGLGLMNSLIQAGYSETTARNLLKAGFMDRPYVQNEVRKRREAFARVSEITKREVVEGFKEAIEMAKLLSEPQHMIAGWKELARLQGLYPDTRARVEIAVSGNIGVRQINTLSDADLMRIASGEVIEGSFSQVVEGAAASALEEEFDDGVDENGELRGE